MTELITRLREAIDEDERLARAAGSATWHRSSGAVLDVDFHPVADDAGWTGIDEDDAEHIARHDPARVLREVAAKREILKLHAPVVLHGGAGARYYDTKTVCASCEPPKGVRAQSEIWPCPTVLALAKGYGIEVE